MAREFFGFDPMTGITRYIEDIGDGKRVATSEQDATALVERNKRWANEGAKDRGIKEGWWHVCDVPPTIWLEMKRKGMDILSPDNAEFKRALRYIQANYPHLKTTHKKIV